MAYIFKKLLIKHTLSMLYKPELKGGINYNEC